MRKLLFLKTLLLGLVLSIICQVDGKGKGHWKKHFEDEKRVEENNRSWWGRRDERSGRRPWTPQASGLSFDRDQNNSPYYRPRQGRRRYNEQEVKIHGFCIPKDQWEYYMLFALIFFLGLFGCIFICVVFIFVKIYNRYLRWRHRKMFGCAQRRSHLPTCNCQCFRENSQNQVHSINSVENINSYDQANNSSPNNLITRNDAQGPYPSFENISTSRNDFYRKDEPPHSKYHLLK